MALGFNSNLFNTSARSSAETAGSLACNNNTNTETAGTLASTETAGTIAFTGGKVDCFESSNPFAQEIDYSQYANIETAGSVASTETAGTLAFIETAGSLACGGAETAGSVASGDCGGSFSSSDGGFVC